MKFIVSATIVRNIEENGITWQQMRQVPTFILNGDIQGILTEANASEVAKMVIDPFGDHTVHANAVAMDWE